MPRVDLTAKLARASQPGPKEAILFDKALPGFEMLRAMMNRAEEWGLRERGSNPCLGIAKNLRKQVARFLDAEELARLERALNAHEARWPGHAALIEEIHRFVDLMIPLERHQLLDNQHGAQLDHLAAAARRAMAETMEEGPA